MAVPRCEDQDAIFTAVRTVRLDDPINTVIARLIFLAVKFTLKWMVGVEGKRSRIRSVAFGCSSSLERRIIRGIQQPPPSSLSSILSVGLGLPRVTLRSNGISDGILFLLVRLCASEYTPNVCIHLRLSLFFPLSLSFFRVLLPFFFFLILTRTHAYTRRRDPCLVRESSVP